MWTAGAAVCCTTYAASIVGFAAALLYHSKALSLIAVLPAYVFLIARPSSEALRPRWWLRFAPFIAIAGLMMIIQTRADVGVTRYVGVGWHQYSELGQYLGYALVPVFWTDWARLHLPKLNYLTDLSLAGSLVMIAATLVLLDRRQWPYRGVFVALWLYAALALNTTQLLGTTPALLYLPGASLALFLVLVARRVNELLPTNLLRRIPPRPVAPRHPRRRIHRSRPRPPTRRDYERQPNVHCATACERSSAPLRLHGIHRQSAMEPCGLR